jgi:hypothetical protein
MMDHHLSIIMRQFGLVGLVGLVGPPPPYVDL